MEVTDIRIHRRSGQGKLKAYVTITFDDTFVVHNLKVIEGDTGLSVAMPNRRTRSGIFKDVAHPISTDFRNRLQEEILGAYVSSSDLDAPVGDDLETDE